jgi:THUMP domain-like
MFDVEDYRWLSTTEAQRIWQSLSVEPTTKLDALLKRLRLHLPTNHASLLAEQFELLALAKKKVAKHQLWFWTRQLLEQSSDFETAAETSLDFQAGNRVWDICCGAGADSVALANRGLIVQAVDRCPIACELTRHNSRSHGLAICVFDLAAEQTEVDSESYVHIDPDRRADGTRSSSLDRLSPGWDTIVRLLGRCRGMSLKLAPGTRVDLNGLAQRVERPPESVRFLAKDGSVRQQRWYWGLERWPEGSVTASMHLNAPSTRRAELFAAGYSNENAHNSSTSYGWFHETFLDSDIHSMNSSELVNAPNEYVADYDPSLRAAELSSSFAKRYGWQLLDSSSGYLTSNEASVHPMVRWFRVEEVLPLDNKRIKSFAREANVRTWELKSRGIDVDLNALRKVLPTEKKSDTNMTILCTKLGNHHRAIFCKELF